MLKEDSMYFKMHPLLNPMKKESSTPIAVQSTKKETAK